MSRLDITFCDSDCKNKECERNQSKIPRGFCVTCVNFSKDCENYKRMTNGDKIRSMSDTELAQLFEKNFKIENIAESWFEKSYCKNKEICETFEGVCDGKVIRFNECDTPDGCPHHKNKTVIEMWLKSEVE